MRVHEQRCTTTAEVPLPCGLTLQKTTLVAIVIKIFAMVMNILAYAVLYMVQNEVTAKAFMLEKQVKIVHYDKMRPSGAIEKVTVSIGSGIDGPLFGNLSRASEFLVQLCLCFWIMTSLMILTTSLSLMPGRRGSMMPIKPSFFETTYHWLASLLLGGTSFVVLALQADTSINNRRALQDDKLFNYQHDAFAAGGALAFTAAILHGLHFVLSLLLWLRVQTKASEKKELTHPWSNRW